MKNHTKLWLRTFDTTDEVILSYDKAAYKLKGNFARSIACTFTTTARSSESASASTSPTFLSRRCNEWGLRVMVCLVTEKLWEEMGRLSFSAT
ncbi:hypothetical protein ACFX2C_007040 [Malus domestica]